MAGDWIKWQKGLAWKPEVVAIAATLGMDRRHVAGCLMEFWEWTDGNMADSNAPTVTGVTLPSLCDRITLVTGLGDAMVKVGWIIQTQDGWHLPNWDRHNGASAKARACGAKRAQTHRNASRSRNCASVTDVTVTALPEKRREEKSVNTPTPPFTSEEFTAAWGDWVVHRTQLKKKLTGKAIEGQYAMLAELGERVAIETIRNSIRHGWTGLFKPNVPQVQQRQGGYAEPNI